ncbi:hypothetical protein [Bradyrhizobium cenepequi]
MAKGETRRRHCHVTKVFGFWIALGGTFLAGWLIRTPFMPSLLIGNVAGSASYLALALPAAHRAAGLWTSVSEHRTWRIKD